VSRCRSLTLARNSPSLIKCLQIFLWLTPCSRVLPEKLEVLRLVKKLPAFYGTRRFITAFTRTRQLSLSWASSIQSILPHPTSWRSISALSFHLSVGLASALFTSGYPTRALNVTVLSLMHATCPAHLIDLIKPIIFSEQYRS